MFAGARCIGERKVNGEDCFILKLCADPETLRARSEGLAEIIRHVLFGYFSQKTGLLVHLEDSHLTRIQSTTGGDAVYWETTINSFIEDYRPVEGIMIAHSGRSAVTLFRFGEAAMSHTKTEWRRHGASRRSRSMSLASPWIVSSRPLISSLDLSVRPLSFHRVRRARSVFSSVIVLRLQL